MERLKTENGKWHLEKIAGICYNELGKIGVPLPFVMVPHIARDQYVFGRFIRTGGSVALHISNVYQNPKYDLSEVKTIICHVLLHAVEGCMDHGRKWREYAEKADREYGLHIIEHEESRPKAKINWEAGDTQGAIVPDGGKCCFLDYAGRLEGLVAECSELLKSIGLNIGNVSTVIFSRDDSAFGRCWKNRDKSHTISVSYFYAKDDADVIGLKSLICHELLHTCPEDDYIPQTRIHGPRWREMARKVERELGYKLMSESHSDAVRKTSGEPIMRYVCPVCGGYYDAHEDREKRNAVRCKWCHQRMNAIREEDRGILDTVYIWLGECQDKLRLAEIPLGTLSGIGFVPEGRRTGYHNNWDETYSIDLPAIYGRKGISEDDGLKEYLCRELLRSCEGCSNYGDKWNEYLQKAEEILKIPPCQEEASNFA